MNFRSSLDAEVMAALYVQRGQTPDQPFTRNDICQWCKSVAGKGAIEQTAKELLRRGYFHQLRQPVDGLPKPYPRNTPQYILTAEGREVAAQAPQPSTIVKAAPACTRSQFARRLWALLRIRGMLTSADAADLLVDAGDDPRRAKVNAAEWLRAWAQAAPDHVQVSKQLVAGCKRYVLVKDLGPTPPAKGART